MCCFFFFFKVGGNTPILCWPVWRGQEQGRERSWHLFWCWEWICSQGCSLTGRDRENLVSWQNFRKKNNILIFCHSAKMAPVLWDYQAKLDIWCGDSSDGMRMTASELVTPGLLQSPQREMGTSKGVICLILKKLSKPILHELCSRYP